MKISPLFLTKPITFRTPPTPPLVFTSTSQFNSNVKRVSNFRPHSFNIRHRHRQRLPVSMTTSPGHYSSPVIESDVRHDSRVFVESIEVVIEKAIYRCRFFTLLGVFGSLIGSFLCFIKGCTYVVSSFMEYSIKGGRVIQLLVEAIDVYLLGTVMLVFGMGLYELFVSNLDSSKSLSMEKLPYASNLFGLFTLKERPKWLDVKTVNELKTKIGHVIVMLLLIGLFDKSKKAIIQSPVDLLCFSASVLLSSGSLFLLSKLNDSN